MAEDVSTSAGGRQRISPDLISPARVVAVVMAVSCG
jgi:hypothetical protein